MSDKIYVNSDIPSSYKYAVFSGDYVTLYAQPSARNETIDFYRIYFKYSYDTYISGQQTFGNNTTTFTEVETSSNFLDRPDSYKMVTIIFVLVFFAIWLLNMFTSMIRKGGLLGGLL